MFCSSNDTQFCSQQVPKKWAVLFGYCWLLIELGSDCVHEGGTIKELYANQNGAHCVLTIGKIKCHEAQNNMVRRNYKQL